ncbi:rhomboid family intramembrane serine protease [Rhodococcus maanshanensis]|uniref:Membrane associated serine protease, rhomboid family n=1 Tax=Rhodococcus maanshanensis TaxID=183556 RepID=A0A1H7YHK7_9NOCA|nr:rhomboid family intramembrane serine protease [Rhodococcus maanshanensis]SEM44808.1 Membrane associated serine protease, rhomboid family [Rhodococcus maanshanensis]
MTNPGWGGVSGDGTPPQPRCVRHPDRPTALSCTRCGRPACVECLRPAAVGQHCVDCIAADAKTTRSARTVAGAPLRTGLPTPIVTYVLIGLNVLIYAITVLQSGNVANNHLGSPLFTSWALWPPAVADGDLVRVLGSGFLHFGAVHLLVNMFALWVIGRDTEIILGRSRYVAVYLVSILGGSAAVMAFQVNAVTAGASGAVFGLMGAQAVILLRLKRSPGPVLAIIALNVIISVTIPGISLWGHLGGLVAGAAATAALMFAPGSLGTPAERQKARNLGWGGLAAVTVVSVGVIALRMAQLRAELGM